jgi:hypothetical protein
VERRCGGCTLCCRLLGVAELAKPAGTWCRHCVKGAGCGIYEDRPHSCRVFRCAWLTTPSWPERLRPDRMGVVPWIAGDGRSLTLYGDPGAPAAWRKPQLRPIIDQVLAHGCKVLVVIGGRSAEVHRTSLGLVKDDEVPLPNELAARRPAPPPGVAPAPE